MKPPTCRAVLSTHCGGGESRRGQRCTELAVEPEGLPQLCWVHARALANRNRARPLELVAMSLREQEAVQEWKAAQLAKGAWQR